MRISGPGGLIAGVLLGGGAYIPGGGGGGGTTIVLTTAMDLCWIAGASVVWTNEPDAETELLGNSNRRKASNLVGMATIQAYAGGTASAGPGSFLELKWSLDGLTFFAFTTPCRVATDNLAAATSTTVGVEVEIPLAAQTHVILAWFGDGDSTPTEDPGWTMLGAIASPALAA